MMLQKTVIFKDKISAQPNTKQNFICDHICYVSWQYMYLGTYHLLKYLMGICLCSMLISLSKVSYLVQNDCFHIFSLLRRPFSVTIATIKVK